MTTAFITLTNDGYIDYTLNCLKSLKNIGMDKLLKSYCMGNECYKKLISLGYSAEKLDINNEKLYNHEKRFREGNWGDIVYMKFIIIYNNLLKYDYVCITDGDIVFLNNSFLDFCKKNLEDNDMITQNDNMSNSNKNCICSGFMFIKSSEKILKLFDPSIMKKDVKPGWGDQFYINSIKNKFKYKLLPLEFFPNGKYYMDLCINKENVYMIHFNWIRGDTKKTIMKKYNKWYLQDSIPNEKVINTISSDIPYYNEKIQLDKEVIRDIMKNMKKGNILVFGLGHDSEMWYNLNKNTYFIENNAAYINLNKNIIPANNIIKYSYGDITVKKSFNLPNNYVEKFTIPEKILRLSPFDIILIDGPGGYNDNQPGRLIPIFWSKYLSNMNTIIYIDDSSRKLESYAIEKYYKNNNKHVFNSRLKCTKIFEPTKIF